ncbi:MAG: hypothetical protein HQL20_01865 [Candidatus Omnitrophica bacterium]|nr:hypothetical protein [Candidatus Omnitrophota bacterium]
MRIKNNGQSVLEYVLLATIIIVGIIIGGPLLLKSVQGYFKLTDDSVQDSTSERFVQGGANGLKARECVCTPGPAVLPNIKTQYPEYAAAVQTWSKGDCGAGNNNASQRYYSRTCSPIKCGAEEAWLDDSECCTQDKPVGCGTKFALSSANTVEEKKCQDNPAGLDSRFDSASYKPTCKATANDFDCSVGARLYVKTCAKKATAGNPAPAAGATDTIYACKGPDAETELNCLPSCWQYPFPGSKPCTTTSGSNTLENDNYMVDENFLLENDDSLDLPQRRELTKEVIARQSYLVEEPPPTSLTSKKLEIAKIEEHHALSKTAGHAPYRILTKNFETSDVMKLNAYRNHYTYLKVVRDASGTVTGQCSATRFCERTCPAGYAPNTEGSKSLRENESCEQIACWYGMFREETNGILTARKICDSQEDPQICYTGTPGKNNDICGYIGICFDTKGEICYQAYSSNVQPVRQLADIYQQCGDKERKILDRRRQKAYCYKILPATGADRDQISNTMPAKFSCDNKDLYFTIVGCEE